MKKSFINGLLKIISYEIIFVLNNKNEYSVCKINSIK